MGNEKEVSENIHRLLSLLGEVCDAEELSEKEELSAVSMLLTVIAFKYGHSKEEVLATMNNIIDKMYVVLAEEDEE